VSNFLQRVLTAAILLPLVLFAIFKLNTEYFATLLFVVATLALFEFITITKLNSLFKVILPLVLLSVVIWVVVGKTHNLGYFFLVIGIWWLSNLITVITYPHNNLFINNPIFKPINAILLFLPFLIVFITLQNINPELLVLLLLIVIGADSGAYFTGRAFGKHKLHPNLSGGKTIEGVIGGVVLALIVVGVYVYFILEQNPFNYLWIVILTAVFSVVGDLYQSAYKRVAGLKDSGKILPGHGGVWDRIDALLAASPIFAILVL
jgi:phosphatidate cytidylyltransferase